MSGNSNKGSFADGFKDGYQQVMRDNMKIGITPICPIPPVTSDNSYQSGFAAGAARAAQDIGR